MRTFLHARQCISRCCALQDVYISALHVFSLLLLQSAEFLQKALCCPGFLHNAILWYLSVLQLFLTGDTYTALPEKKVEPSQILKDTKQFVMSLISQAPPAALSSSQLRQVTHSTSTPASHLSCFHNTDSPSSLLPVWSWWVYESSWCVSVQT
ncbi:hypothetical protein AMECASPLE_038084 [Ameca splendens]|uniref:Uncharacterized protein n=1 Tax=Ameca splendens TaxID=208324 RepID=A0ABV0YV65_9TELE